MMAAFLLLAMIACGVWLSVINRRDIVLAWQSRKWPVAAGQITEKGVLSGISIGTDTTTGLPIEVLWKDLYLIYCYRVGEWTHIGNQFDFSGCGLRLNTHYYELKERVSVYYCPNDPSIAVLRPGMRSNLLFGPLLIITGLCCMAWIL